MNGACVFLAIRDDIARCKSARLCVCDLAKRDSDGNEGKSFKKVSESSYVCKCGADWKAREYKGGEVQAT